MKKIFLSLFFGGNKVIKGYILDISKGGLGVACTQKIKKNTLIRIVPASKSLLELKGKVTYIFELDRKSYKYKIGIQFKGLNANQKHSVKNFIAHLTDKRRIPRLRLG